MRIVKDPDIRKIEILDGAIKVFAQRGYDGTTISDIAKELKISQGLCYRYFPSKDSIYEAALEKYAEKIANENLRRIDMELPVRKMIEASTRRMEDFRAAEKDDSGLYELFHSENGRRLHDELFLRVTQKLIPHMQEYLRNAKQKDEINIEDTDAAAVFGMYGWMGLCMDKALSDEERLKKGRIALYKLLGL